MSTLKIVSVKASDLKAGMILEDGPVITSLTPKHGLIVMSSDRIGGDLHLNPNYVVRIQIPAVEVVYNRVGEITTVIGTDCSYGEWSDVTSSVDVTECSVCHALLSKENEAGHTEWHNKLGA
jgi:hypothetical protein